MVATARVLFAMLVWAQAVAPASAGWLPDVGRQLERAKSMATIGRLDRARAYVLTVAPARITLAWTQRPEEGSAADAALRRAVEAWNRALEGESEFLWVEDGSSADVLVSVRETLGEGGRSFAGLTRWVRSVQGGRGRLTGELALATKAQSGRRLTPQELLHAALHELGHLLGLADASDATSVMAPLGMATPCAEPSADDLQAVRRLRIEALGVLSR